MTWLVETLAGFGLFISSLLGAPDRPVEVATTTPPIVVPSPVPVPVTPAKPTPVIPETAELNVITKPETGGYVYITEPTLFMERAKDCVVSQGWYGASGNGLSIDWGDGETDPTYYDQQRGVSCEKDVIKHRYLESGTYVIKARLWHPGPTDAPVTEWEGSATVTVKAIPAIID